MNYDWNFLRLKPYLSAFVAGTLTTLEITAVVIVVGTVLGVVIGISMRQRTLALILYPVIDAIRAVPPLVLLLFCYYFLTQNVIGVGLDAFWICVIALSINLAAFTSDLVRAALEAVPSGAIDAGLALGLSPSQLRIRLQLPYILRDLIPGMMVLYIGMLKATSLASIITVNDLVFSAQLVITRTARSLEAWIIVAGIYIAIVLPATYGARCLERWSRSGRRTNEYQ